MNEEKVLAGMVCDIYNRCSTTEEAQNRAIEVQAEESKELVLQMGGSIYKQYIEQESGTSTRKRNQYASLITDVKEGKIDCIVIKSIDRLMRNAGDWHEFIHLITANNVRLYLYLEKKFYEPEDAFLSGIKALIAEQYSRELSQKVNNAHKRRQHMEKGRLTLTSAVFGYQKCGDEFQIQEKEAAWIRKIYAMSACGAGSRRIAKELYSLGMRGRNGNAVSDVTIRRIIKNPLYMGMAVMNKTHYDFERKKTIRNPQEEWICHPGRVPQIVDQTLWQEANKALEQRAGNAGQKQQREVCCKKNSLLAGKLVCGICQSSFYSKKSSTGKKYWICGRQHQNSAGKVCKNIPVYEEELLSLFRREFEEPVFSEMVTALLKILETVLTETQSNAKYPNWEEEIKQLEKRKKILMNKLMEEVISDSDFKLMNGELENQIKELQKQGDSAEKTESRLEKIKTILSGKDTKADVWQRAFWAAIETIQVRPEGTLEMTFQEEGKTIVVPYRHKNIKTRQKEEKIMQIYDCLAACNTLTAAQIGEQVGLSANNVLQKTKELERQGKLSYVNRGSRGGYWKLSGAKDKFIPEKEEPS